jgi:hypothetical protein
LIAIFVRVASFTWENYNLVIIFFRFKKKRSRQYHSLCYLGFTVAFVFRSLNFVNPIRRGSIIILFTVLNRKYLRLKIYFTFIPGDADGRASCSWIKTFKPSEFDAEYLFFEFGKKKLINKPKDSPWIVECFNGTRSPLLLKPELNFQQLPNWKSKYLGRIRIVYFKLFKNYGICIKIKTPSK